MGDEQESPGTKTTPRALSRRSFLGVAGGVAVGAGGLAAGLGLSGSNAPVTGGSYRNAAEPFYGTHQGGIVTTPQSDSYFASFDVATERRGELVEVLQTWSDTAARLCAGKTAAPLSDRIDAVQPDSGEAMDLGPARLTVNFGFCPTLFRKDGEDRFGIASRRPAALVDLPRFPGEQLLAEKTGGDLTVQACADDPQVAFHALRQLARAADGVATMRWVEAGFNETPASSGTARNLMGFKDGTMNPRGAPEQARFVWASDEGPRWMRGGSYLVARRIRIVLEHWDTETLSVQEQVIGRHKVSGAPLGEQNEFDSLDLDKKSASGDPVIPLDAHVRLAAPQANKGMTFLRRSYAYDDGISMVTERWPPWKQIMTYDAGLLFCAYQRDPRTGFIPIFSNLALNDALNQFATHNGSVIAALPPGAAGPGHFVGEGLFT